MFDPASIYPEKPYRLSRAEYDQMVTAGLFEDKKVELLHGIIVEMSPQGVEHSFAIMFLTNFLAQKLAGRAMVGPQLPMAVSEDSEPEPDLFVVPVQTRPGHPERALLIIEVAVSSLAKDRGLKADLYAATGQPEYWLLDIRNRRLIVYRHPLNGRYADIRSYADGESVSPEAFPDIQVPVSGALPPP